MSASLGLTTLHPYILPKYTIPINMHYSPHAATYYFFIFVLILSGSFIPSLQGNSLHKPKDLSPPTPENFRAQGYDSHAELCWLSVEGTTATRIIIYRSTDNGENFLEVARLLRSDTLYIDWVRPLGTELDLQYRISTVDVTGEESPLSAPVEAVVRPMSDEELQEMVQEYTFRYFWDFAHPVSGLARERSNGNNPDLVTMGGSGFGIMAIIVGIERGFITREQGLDRLLRLVIFLEIADRFRGAYPHWMNGQTGDVIPFSQRDNGGDIVETAFLFQGLLCARQYFDGDDPSEFVLRDKITRLYREIDWNWYRKQNQNIIFWHWSPDFNFAINLPVRGWNETMMVYLLAIASPTKGIPASLWDKGWAGGNYVNGNEYFGIELPLGPPRGGPLFFTHYSFMGFDPRGIRDDYANYFVQNRNQTLINRAYCIDNPEGHEGYSEVSWGLTASDDPLVGYLAHEPTRERDNGTLTPTAALSSMPYTPEESMAALRHFYRDLGEKLWGPMGFFDAFNQNEDWVADSYLAIDQGPIINMIENHRSGLLWDLFMSSPEIPPALDAIGFVEDSLSTAVHPLLSEKTINVNIFPNPVREALNIQVHTFDKEVLSLQLIDSRGRVIRDIVREQSLPAGVHNLTTKLSPLPAGLYFLRIRTLRSRQMKKVFIIK